MSHQLEFIRGTLSIEVQRVELHDDHVLKSQKIFVKFYVGSDSVKTRSVASPLSSIEFAETLSIQLDGVSEFLTAEIVDENTWINYRIIGRVSCQLGRAPVPSRTAYQLFSNKGHPVGRVYLKMTLMHFDGTVITPENQYLYCPTHKMISPPHHTSMGYNTGYPQHQLQLPHYYHGDSTTYPQDPQQNKTDLFPNPIGEDFEDGLVKLSLPDPRTGRVEVILDDDEIGHFEDEDDLFGFHDSSASTQPPSSKPPSHTQSQHQVQFVTNHPQQPPSLLIQPPTNFNLNPPNPHLSPSTQSSLFPPNHSKFNSNPPSQLQLPNPREMPLHNHSMGCDDTMETDDGFCLIDSEEIADEQQQIDLHSTNVRDASLPTQFPQIRAQHATTQTRPHPSQYGYSDLLQHHNNALLQLKNDKGHVAHIPPTYQFTHQTTAINDGTSPQIISHTVFIPANTPTNTAIQAKGETKVYRIPLPTTSSQTPQHSTTPNSKNLQHFHNRVPSQNNPPSISTSTPSGSGYDPHYPNSFNNPNNPNNNTQYPPTNHPMPQFYSQQQAMPPPHDQYPNQQLRKPRSQLIAQSEQIPSILPETHPPQQYHPNYPPQYPPQYPPSNLHNINNSNYDNTNPPPPFNPQQQPQHHHSPPHDRYPSLPHEASLQQDSTQYPIPAYPIQATFPRQTQLQPPPTITQAFQIPTFNSSTQRGQISTFITTTTPQLVTLSPSQTSKKRTLSIQSNQSLSNSNPISDTFPCSTNTDHQQHHSHTISSLLPQASYHSQQLHGQQHSNAFPSNNYHPYSINAPSSNPATTTPTAPPATAISSLFNIQNANMYGEDYYF